MAIDFKHPDYADNIDRWQLCENICSGMDVKQYLLTLNPNDDSTENTTRNKQYKDRAVFYRVAGHTLAGTTGLMFAKTPDVNLPKSMEYMEKNVDGAGVSITQQAQDTAKEVQKKGRAGLLVSYPRTDGPVSKADMAAGGYLATIHSIDATQIINWRTEMRGSMVVLSLVVIEETVKELQEDGYTTKDVTQLRELALIKGIFNIREWRKSEDKNDEWVIHNEFIPRDSSGKAWNEILFTFVGATSNSHRVDEPPMLPMCEINKSHYRNSADYEDSVWYTGQAQPWMSGITQTHIDLMKENKMYFGSRNITGVPTGEQLGIVAAPPNTMVREAMNDKLDAMVGMGARFIQPNGQVKTATEAEGDAKAQYSGLAMVSVNVSDGYNQALEWAKGYMGESDDASIEISSDFVSPTATAQDIQAMVAGFLQGAIPMGDYLQWLKSRELVDSEKDIETFAAEVGAASMPDFGAESDNE